MYSPMTTTGGAQIPKSCRNMSSGRQSRPHRLSEPMQVRHMMVFSIHFQLTLIRTIDIQKAPALRRPHKRRASIAKIYQRVVRARDIIQASLFATVL
jgi:hypothetical protein